MKRFVVTLIGLKLWLLLVFVTLYFSAPAIEIESASIDAQATPTPSSAEKTKRKTSDPYTGDLSIFEDAARDKNLQIDRVMDILRITDGKSVADIGAGSGWFTVRAAKRVGTTGQIFAVEINQEYINHINRRAAVEGFKNIRTVLGKADDPLLSPSSVDVVFLLKTYHEIAEPVALMRKVRSAMKKGGLVGIIDRNGSGTDHGLDKDVVIRELKLAGFSLREQYDFVKPDGMDYFLVFE